MKREDLLASLRVLVEDSKRDCEGAHIRADEILIEYLNDPEITALWNEMNRWYS